ncbi:MAG TPA: CooT family nickel-binding protein [Clostridiales bacterium]|nr:CooT family nickel-binding protein [Clostridiales bacterium]
MCEANVFIKDKEAEKYELLLEAVDKVIPGDDEIILESIFGERKIVKAKIKEMMLLDHKINLERI